MMMIWLEPIIRLGALGTPLPVGSLGDVKGTAFFALAKDFISTAPQRFEELSTLLPAFCAVNWTLCSSIWLAAVLKAIAEKEVANLSQ